MPYCTNHPEKETKRRCYACKTYICTPCIMRADHHFFCSPTCHLAWKAEEPPRRPRRRQRKNTRSKSKAKNRKKSTAAESAPPPAFRTFIVPPAPVALPPVRVHIKEEPRRRHPSVTALVIGNVLLLLAVLWLAGGSTIGTSVISASFHERLNQAAGWYLPPEIQGAPVQTAADTIIIEGVANGAEEVHLLIDGRVVDRLEVRDDVFQSDAHPLALGRTMFQVMSETPDGIRYSKASMVTRIDGTDPHEELRLVVGRLNPRTDIGRGNPHRRAVSFTFDGGSSANAAEDILDVFRLRNLQTTLFLTGEFIRNYPDIVLRALEDGHEIANHTYDHPHLTTFNQNRRHDLREGITREWFERQLRDTEEAYFEVTGQKMAPFWRAPYGELNAELLQWAADLGYRHINWSRNMGGVGTLDSLDWVADPGSPLYLSGDRFYERFANLARYEDDTTHGAIILMHLGTQRQSDALHHQLADLLDTYTEQGFQILPVSQLIASEG